MRVPGVCTVLPALAVILPLPLVGAALRAAASEEAFLSGEDLQELCKGVDASCTTYVLGILDAVHMMESRSGSGSSFCAPEVTSDDVTDVVTKHLKRHPARWDRPAAGLVVEALVEAFPCDAGGG